MVKATTKTLDLKEILTKLNVRYIEWDRLLKKITKIWKAKLGLTDTSSALDVQNALFESIGDHLMFAHKGEEKILCLAVKMSQEEWSRLIFEEINSILTTILTQHRVKEKRSYLKVNAAVLKVFDYNTKTAPVASKLEKIIAPFLGSELTLFTKKPERGKEVLYLAYNLPPEEFIKESYLVLSTKKTFALKTLAGDVPMSNKDFVAVFNRMLTAGQVQITRIDDKFAITGVKIPTPDGGHGKGEIDGLQVASCSLSQPVAALPHPSQLNRGQALALTSHSQLVTQPGANPHANSSLATCNSLLDAELFHAAFVKLDHGRIYVRICNMRRELGWSVERFNTLLRKLRADGTIQLHAGDPSTLTQEDNNLSFMDENNMFYATLTWKKP